MKGIYERYSGEADCGQDRSFGLFEGRHKATLQCYIMPDKDWWILYDADSNKEFDNFMLPMEFLR